MNYCFQIYFQPVYIYIKRTLSLAFENDSILIFTAGSVTVFMQILKDFFSINWFGVSYLTLFLVISTILIDAYYGIKKSVKESKLAKLLHDGLVNDSPEKRALYKTYEIKKFNPKKLQYTFFKVFTLLGYLFFVKSLISEQINGDIMLEVIGFGSIVVLKAPIVIFWYYDFKSIGNNTTFLYGKKAPIFKIVEAIFEMRILNFLDKKQDDETI